MEWTIARGAFLFAAAFAAGAVNSVAGGGTLLSFPAMLVVGIPPTIANATNALALSPGSASAGWAYRSHLKKSDARLLVATCAPSAVGGVLGAFLLLHVSESTFAALVPWLLLAATLLFLVQGRFAKSDETTEKQGDMTTPALVGVGAFQLVVATYGGFFGAGMGILMLAALGLAGMRDVHRMNAVRSFATTVINGVASIAFIVGHRIDWGVGVLMAVGAVAGGGLGAGVARKLGRRFVRGAVATIGVVITVALFARRLRG